MSIFENFFFLYKHVQYLRIDLGATIKTRMFRVWRKESLNANNFFFEKYSYEGEETFLGVFEIG